MGKILVSRKHKQLLQAHKWRQRRDGYVTRHAKIAGAWTKIYLHREITGAKPGEIVDHVNGNPVDNRLENLRITDQSGNLQNRRGPTRRSKTGVRGVYPQGARFVAEVKLRGRKHCLGSFGTIAQAALVVEKFRKRNLLCGAAA